MLCKKAKCRNAFSRNFAGGRYLSTPVPSYPSKTPIKSGLPERTKPDRAWHIVAGGPLTASQLHCATLADGEIANGVPTWEESSYQRIEAQNRKALEKHFAAIEIEVCRRDSTALDHCWSCGREDDLTDRANPTLCYPCFHKRHRPMRHRPDLVIPDDLSIPTWLDRRAPQPLQEAA
jgi:hypothetical protein